MRAFHFLIVNFSFLILHFTAKAQFAIVNDPDGYTNVRDGKGTNAIILGRISEDDVFLHDGEDGEIWRGIFKDSTIIGFIHNTRLTPLEYLPRIPEDAAHRTMSARKLTLHNDSIQFEISTAPFIANDHHIVKSIVDDLYSIDGKRPWGSWRQIPTTQIDELKLTIKGQSITIPEGDFADLYEPSINSVGIFFFKNRIYLYMPFNSSDAAGGYSVVWIIKDGKYLKRYVDSL